MAYEWKVDFEDGQTRAVCSKCGVPYRFPAEIVRLNDGYYYCKRRCLEQTVITRDRIQAQSRKRREQPPPKFIQAPSYADDYEAAEAAQFETIATTAASSTDAAVLGWSANYFADLAIQNLRNPRWVARAKSLLATCCTRLLTLQYGAPTGPSPSLTVDRIRYGGLGDGTTLYTSTTAIAGVALTKGYSVLGTSVYLDGASRCAHFLRHMQCQDMDNNAQYTTWGGARYHVGGFAAGVTASGTITWTTVYNLFDGIGAWFLGVLRTLQGGSTQYGSSTTGVDFASSTVATLDTMISECVAFLTTGAYDTSTNTLRTGLSTSYPHSFYMPQANGSTNPGTWGYQVASGSPSVCIYGRDFAGPLFALNYLGQATDTVNAIFDWLMTFTANPSNAAPAEDPILLIGNTLGSYDPKRAIADKLDVIADDDTVLTREHVGAVYDWQATALLAPIASVRLPTYFTASKNDFSTPQPSSRNVPPLYRYIAESGRSGLSLQWVSP
jgi:hypothetical protein